MRIYTQLKWLQKNRVVENSLRNSGLAAQLGGGLILYGLIMSLLFAALGGIVNWRSESNRQLDQIHDLLATVEKTASVACYTGNDVMAREVVDGLLVNHAVLGVMVLAGERVLAIAGSEAVKSDNSSQVVSKVLVSPYNMSERIGSVVLLPNYSYIRELTFNYTIVNLSVLILYLLVIVAITVWLIMRTVVRPVCSMSRGVDSIDVDSTGYLAAQGTDELRHLAESFNTLLARNRLHTAMEQAMVDEIKNSERLLRTLFEISPDFILRFDVSGQSLYANPACYRIFCIESDAEDDVAWCPVMNGMPPPRVLHEMLGMGEPYRFLWEWHDASGSQGCYEVIVVAEYNRDGERLDGMLSIGRDITERVQAERRLEYEATHDSLTGLPNRAYFKERLRQAISTVNRFDQSLSLVFVDLDNFKDVNDSMGHETGDELLKHVASSLRAVLRDGDTVARLGGDEFVVLLEGFDPDSDVGGLIERIYGALSQPCTVGGRIVRASASLGVAVYPRDGEDVDSLMCNADTAMYAAKSSGRATYRLFTKDMHAEVNEWASLGQDMHRALERGEFELHYQPKLTLQDGKLSGFEALIRWRHPQRGLIPPVRFIPMAERNGLIDEIGTWVLNEACRQVASWRGAGLMPGKMAINLSAQQCRWGDFSLAVHDSLLRHEIPGVCL
jgi:diguanylate cyclase (GGDEF)-like protein/PAS domain S-box-containing protein